MTDRTRTIDQRLLLAAAQAGDKGAFRELVEPYRHALEVHCYRILGSAQDAEDLVQETLLRAWRAFDRFEPRAQFQTWLYRIATNACLDELGRRSRRPEPVDPFPNRHVTEAAPPTYDPGARYAIREGMELALVRAIQELPGRQRAVLIFRDVLGWSAPEVAEVLQSTVASVNSALQRARATVEQHLPETPQPVAGRAERELVDRYIDAFEHDDMDGLVSLLRDDAVLRMPPQQSLIGAVQIARFFHDRVGRGDLTRIRLTLTWANGRPATVIHLRTESGGFVPHGISVLEIDGGQIVGIDAFTGATLLPRFGFPAHEGSGLLH
ncbi:MAG: sigma-70 family RNA polymerase sigma factor [Solirubrobacterales bacterium]|nr:sigma-70 family RNA polymerase sigma factor [Solirubrobacterales bacterium]MBV9944915.1 sigma-70 family RNA polymerase sigma factor [Solirubrobacterales bacterium]